MDVRNNESYIVNIYSNTEKFHFAQIVMTGLRIKKQYLITAGLFWMKLGFCVKISGQNLLTTQIKTHQKVTFMVVHPTFLCERVLMGNHMTVILLPSSAQAPV